MNKIIWRLVIVIGGLATVAAAASDTGIIAMGMPSVAAECRYLVTLRQVAVDALTADITCMQSQLRRGETGHPCAWYEARMQEATADTNRATDALTAKHGHAPECAE